MVDFLRAVAESVLQFLKATWRALSVLAQVPMPPKV